MSLINDALRRAKDAQQEAPLPPSHDLPYRPVEPAQQSARRGPGLLRPCALAAVALVALLFAWQWVQKHDSTGSIEANARTARIVNAIPAPPPASAPALASAAQPNPAVQPASLPSPATGAAATLAADTTSTATEAPLADPEEGQVTNTTAMTPPPPPKPVPLRLQAIVFNPKRPSAMVSGKTLFVGDKLGSLRVVAIDRESATLVGAGQTNVLSLAQ